MTEGEGGAAGAKATPAPAPPPLPADVGLVAALSIEVAPLFAGFKRVRKYTANRFSILEGECGGKLVAAVLTGPGRKAARRGAELLLAGHRPRWIVSAGFGGALDPALKRNAIVLPTEVVDVDGGRFAIDVGLPDGAPGFVPGRLLTADAIARTAVEKAGLAAKYGATVVDMETAAVASLCSERGVRFLSVRVVSDEADVDLPPEVMSVLGATGSYRIGATLGALWRRPSSLKDLWNLREQAMTAADRLAEVLPGMFAQLPS